MTDLDTIIAATAGRPGPIGVFDSGYGGLSVLRSLQHALPQSDFLYLGDNARAPYGNRSFELVYKFTLEAVRYLFARGCQLVILACNTASAKALRTIQQRDLPGIDRQRRVLGVIRPTTEAVGVLSRNGHVGLVATTGTVASGSYEIELKKLSPGVQLTALACPMWAPLVENGEADTPGADYFVGRDLKRLFAIDNDIDTLILGCTHYPLLLKSIQHHVPAGVTVITQGYLVANSLVEYLRRHPEMDARITRNGRTEYLTTDEADRFAALAQIFMGEPVKASRVHSLASLEDNNEIMT